MKKPKKSQNRYSRSAKYSEYKTLQLVECFARDFSIQQTFRITKMSERTIRDRYADIRGKLLGWSVDAPDRFNGFGHLLLDPAGTINIHVLELLFYYSEFPAFKSRMKNRYPKFNTKKDSILPHVIEIVIRRFTAIDLPKVNENYFNIVKTLFASAQSEAYLSSIAHNLPAFKTRKLYWQNATRRMSQQHDYTVRRFPKAQGETFFRYLKTLLRLDPL